MTTNYPAQIDNSTSLPPAIDNLTPVVGAVVNKLQGAIIAIETELGVHPSTVYGTVRNRLDIIESLLTTGGLFTPGGDLAGTATNQIVIGIQGVAISSMTPTVGQVLTATSEEEASWETPVAGFVAGGDLSGTTTNQTVIGIQSVVISSTPPSSGQVLTAGSSSAATWATPATGFTAGGDLSGSSTSQEVVGFFGRPLASTAPVASAVPVWSGSIYSIRQLTTDDLGAGFSITGFSGGSTVEIGATVTNPAFTASYSATPSAASITNTDGIDSPLTLSFPYTSGTVIGAFHHTAAATVTFTLSATGTSTKTATQSISYEARSFSGVGNAGAASATASGTSAVLNGGLGTLSVSALYSNVVGQTFTVTPSSQKVYLLFPHTSSAHTFSAGGFSFPMNAPTTFSFTNVNSAVVSMDLYESTNTLSATYAILVVT